MLPGGGELLLIFLVVLLLFGGKELPRLARMLGRWSSVMRRSLNEVRREFNRIGIEDELKEVSKSFKETYPDRPKPTAPPPDPNIPRWAADDDNEYIPPDLPYPEAIEPTRNPAVNPSPARRTPSSGDARERPGDASTV